jgi:hypothetical protein
VHPGIDSLGPSGRRTWRLLAFGAIGFTTLLVLFVMSGLVSGFRLGGTFPWIQGSFHFPALLEANTPAGGDMGAHVLLPQVLRDSLLPTGRILGWSMDWYAGFPVLFFYFPLPALATVLLDVALPYGVAFKLVSIAGLVALPAAAYFFVRSMGFVRPVATIAAVAGSGFLFMESFSIYGGNIKSTLAGEFSFSWSLALALVYLGLVIGDGRQGRGFRPLPGIVLALAALAHVVPVMVAVVVSLPLLMERAGRRVLVGSWVLGGGLAAFWALPFVAGVFGGMHTNMGWFPVQGWTAPVPDELVPVLVLGLIGIGWTLLRRDDVVVAVWMTGLPLAGYFLLPRAGITVLYNARLLPFWYLGLYLFAGIAVGLALMEAVRRMPERRKAVVVGTAAASLLLINTMLFTVHDVPAWVRWNFTGYEGKADYPQYATLLQTIDRLPPGRVMWEVNSDQNRFGTPMALMLIPYWTEEHDSMEGVFFESSITTPFHFLNASEVSTRPSNPVRGLRYRPIDFDRAREHLAVYGISYYVSFTEGARDLAVASGLPVLAEAEPWTVFDLPDSPLVEVATHQPAVYRGEEDFFDVALEWYDDLDNLDHWVVASGPDDWPGITDGAGPFDVGAALDVSGAVSDVEMTDHSVSFRTTAVGVPHLVKVSYFPNWQVTGADGPYRAAPSLMLVVPTEEEVVLEFGRTGVERLGIATSLAAAAVAVGVWLRRRTARRRSEPVSPAA